MGRSQASLKSESLDLSTNDTTTVFAAPDLSNLSIHVICDGSVAGSPEVTLQGSNDNSHWDDVDGYVSNPLSASDQVTWALSNTAIIYYRVRVSTAGTAGTADVIFNGNCG